MCYRLLVGSGTFQSNEVSTVAIIPILQGRGQNLEVLSDMAKTSLLITGRAN